MVGPYQPFGVERWAGASRRRAGNGCRYRKRSAARIRHALVRSSRPSWSSRPAMPVAVCRFAWLRQDTVRPGRRYAYGSRMRRAERRNAACCAVLRDPRSCVGEHRPAGDISMRTHNGPAVRLGDVERAPVVSAIGDVCRTEALGRPDCDQRIAHGQRLGLRGSLIISIVAKIMSSVKCRGPAFLLHTTWIKSWSCMICSTTVSAASRLRRFPPRWRNTLPAGLGLRHPCARGPCRLPSFAYRPRCCGVL